MTNNTDRSQYRVWDIKNRKFLREDHEEKDYQQVSDFGMMNLLLWRFSHNNNYILIQCTGLKDKNCKLIYEGDIVKVPEYHILGIKRSKKFNFIRTVERPNSFYGYDFTYADTGLKYVEIIGNKYENPELIKNAE